MIRKQAQKEKIICLKTESRLAAREELRPTLGHGSVSTPGSTDDLSTYPDYIGSKGSMVQPRKRKVMIIIIRES